MMGKRLLVGSTVAALVVLVGLSGCDESSDQKLHRGQEILNQQAADAVGMPAISNFAEKKLLKMVLELRDQNVPTITYITDMQGHHHKLCDSIGYGIPYATQYTNPQRWVSGGATIPQADPNTLFSPAAAEGTWVACLNPDTKAISPVYVEDRITTSSFALKD